jgi:indole-3-glycerol phosphate synthase
MNILQRIVEDKKNEVALRKALFPESYWEQAPLFERPTVSLKDSLLEKAVGIIAEHKRRSPSKAVINQSGSVASIAKAYSQAGVGGMSVLTDSKYFGGSLEDLIQARAVTSLPLLRKEFIIDPYQLIEAKAHGADAILLIAAVLDRKEIKQLSETAQSLGLEVLLEVHNREELEKALMPSLDLLGVNNRDLKAFRVHLEISKTLAAQIPDDFVKVSESGISSPEAVRELKPYGYRGFLIGEHLMRADNIQSFTHEFIQACQD